MSITLTSPAGELTLQRTAPTNAVTGSDKSSAMNLQAWDAADELLLHYAADWLAHRPEARVLVIDDNFGALTLGLAHFQPVTLADSAALAPALAHNRELSRPQQAIPGSIAAPLSWLNDTASLSRPDIAMAHSAATVSGVFDLVVLRIPRYRDYLAWLLRRINGLLARDGVLLAGGMIKHLPDRSVEVFAAAVITEQVFPARKKARVVMCRQGSATLAGWGGQWCGYSLAQGDGVARALEVVALPAVFARERLDIGTRALLPWVTQAAARLAPGARVLDLACGNGVLGLAVLAAVKNAVELTFSDVSSQAVISAAANAAREFPDCTVHCSHADGIADSCRDSGRVAEFEQPRADAECDTFDLILLNPPFHDGGAVGDHIALSLFAAAQRHLDEHGRLLLVGNRHLGYHRSLGRFFPQVRQLDANSRFVIFEAGHGRC